jgi:hypothetical protein
VPREPKLVILPFQKKIEKNEKQTSRLALASYFKFIF